jgi:hypothetical protein
LFRGVDSDNDDTSEDGDDTDDEEDFEEGETALEASSGRPGFLIFKFRV